MIYCSFYGDICTEKIIKKKKKEWSSTEQASNETVAKHFWGYLLSDPDRYIYIYIFQTHEYIYIYIHIYIHQTHTHIYIYLYNDVNATRLWLVVAYDLSEYRYIDDVTGNLFSLFCSTWGAVLKMFVRLFRIKASKSLEKRWAGAIYKREKWRKGDKKSSWVLKNP